MRPLSTHAPRRHGFGRAASTAALLLIGSLAAPALAQEAKEMLGLMYAVQMAPKVCQWTDAGPSTNLDAKIAEAEKALGISDADRTTLRTQAEAEIRKDMTGNCDPKGMLRAMYNDPG